MDTTVIRKFVPYWVTEVTDGQSRLILLALITFLDFPFSKQLLKVDGVLVSTFGSAIKILLDGFNPNYSTSEEWTFSYPVEKPVKPSHDSGLLWSSYFNSYNLHQWTTGTTWLQRLVTHIMGTYLPTLYHMDVSTLSKMFWCWYILYKMFTDGILFRHASDTIHTRSGWINIVCKEFHNTYPKMYSHMGFTTTKIFDLFITGHGWNDVNHFIDKIWNQPNRDYMSKIPMACKIKANIIVTSSNPKQRKVVILSVTEYGHNATTGNYDVITCYIGSPVCNPRWIELSTLQSGDNGSDLLHTLLKRMFVMGNLNVEKMDNNTNNYRSLSIYYQSRTRISNQLSILTPVVTFERKWIDYFRSWIKDNELTLDLSLSPILPQYRTFWSNIEFAIRVTNNGGFGLILDEEMTKPVLCNGLSKWHYNESYRSMGAFVNLESVSFGSPGYHDEPDYNSFVEQVANPKPLDWTVMSDGNIIKTSNDISEVITPPLHYVGFCGYFNAEYNTVPDLEPLKPKTKTYGISELVDHWSSTSSKSELDNPKSWISTENPYRIQSLRYLVHEPNGSEKCQAKTFDISREIIYDYAEFLVGNLDKLPDPIKVHFLDHSSTLFCFRRKIEYCNIMGWLIIVAQLLYVRPKKYLKIKKLTIGSESVVLELINRPIITHHGYDQVSQSGIGKAINVQPIGHWLDEISGKMMVSELIRFDKCPILDNLPPKVHTIETLLSYIIICMVESRYTLVHDTQFESRLGGTINVPILEDKWRNMLYGHYYSETWQWSNSDHLGIVVIDFLDGLKDTGLDLDFMLVRTPSIPVDSDQMKHFIYGQEFIEDGYQCILCCLSVPFSFIISGSDMWEQIGETNLTSTLNFDTQWIVLYLTGGVSSFLVHDIPPVSPNWVVSGKYIHIPSMDLGKECDIRGAGPDNLVLVNVIKITAAIVQQILGLSRWMIVLKH